MTYSNLLKLAVAIISFSAPGAHATDVMSVDTMPDNPSFDIQKASITKEGNALKFRMEVAGAAGEKQPKAIGKLAGSDVYSYVWPTSFDPSLVGFSPDTGILAFAATSHPDFDDTPLFDEDGDGDAANDGRIWHSHWVVLNKTDECGPTGLKVRDIKKGEVFDLPKTWPELPLFIDSPGWHPSFTQTSIEILVPFEKSATLVGASFDGVTSALRVNANAHAPLLCVSAVFEVASGDLSLPGKID
ncbi:hypothetical protein [Lentilitoribacter sp. Alg239-R112]|uniref:hypothetical protein n=1 Tax=Lentilitoribacter sp. Alg239-R112 TaxID=2305987 RepID=UPI0018D9EC88|nr:hypothetical protein [Lentilitoribacter sp. Alg239-R112]